MELPEICCEGCEEKGWEYIWVKVEGGKEKGVYRGKIIKNVEMGRSGVWMEGGLM